MKVNNFFEKEYFQIFPSLLMKLGFLLHPVLCKKTVFFLIFQNSKNSFVPTTLIRAALVTHISCQILSALDCPDHGLSLLVVVINLDEDRYEFFSQQIDQVYDF